MVDTSIKTSSPIYQPLLDQLRRSIKTGNVKPGHVIASEHKLARDTGLSRVSIRRAVQELVDEGLAERRAGKGVFVRELSTATRIVEALVPNLEINRCVQIVRGAKQFGLQRGVLLRVSDAHGSVDTDLERLRQLPGKSADGALILSLHRPGLAEILHEFNRQVYPFVLVDERIAGISGISILSDNYQGGYTVGQELVRLGHRSVGFIGDLSTHTARDRLDGLRDAVNDAGIAFDRSLVCDVDTTLVDAAAERKAARQATLLLMDRPKRPTALFYAFDTMAAEGYKALRDLALKIPKDVSVVGFDDDSICKLVDPALATVSQKPLETGRLAMEMLLKRISGDLRETVCHLIETEWMPRESIGPCPDSS